MKQIVIDASLTLSWCFPEEKTSYSSGVLAMLDSDVEAVVPGLWPLEILNTLVLAERRRRITYQQALEFLVDIAQIEIQVEATTSKAAFSDTFDDTYALARKHNLTSYDAAYLELTIRRGLPLASLDGDLNKAALASGVKLVEVSPEEPKE